MILSNLSLKFSITRFKEFHIKKKTRAKTGQKRKLIKKSQKIYQENIQNLRKFPQISEIKKYKNQQNKVIQKALCAKIILLIN